VLAGKRPSHAPAEGASNTSESSPPVDIKSRFAGPPPQHVLDWTVFPVEPPEITPYIKTDAVQPAPPIIIPARFSNRTRHNLSQQWPQGQTTCSNAAEASDCAPLDPSKPSTYRGEFARLPLPCLTAQLTLASRSANMHAASFQAVQRPTQLGILFAQTHPKIHPAATGLRYGACSFGKIGCSACPPPSRGLEC